MFINDAKLTQANYIGASPGEKIETPQAINETPDAKIETEDSYKSGEKILTKKEAKALKLIKKKGKKVVSDLKFNDSVTWALSGSGLFPLNIFAAVAGACDSFSGRTPESEQKYYDNAYKTAEKYFKEHTEKESMQMISEYDPKMHEKLVGKGIIRKAFDKIKEALTPLPKGTTEDEAAGKEVITAKERKMLNNIKRGTRSELLRHVFGGSFAELGPGLLLGAGAMLMVSGVVGASVGAALLGVGTGVAGVVTAARKIKINNDYKKEIDKEWENIFLKKPEEKSSKDYRDANWNRTDSRSGKLSYWWDFERNMDRVRDGKGY
jgi:hypothetical protein